MKKIFSVMALLLLFASCSGGSSESGSNDNADLKSLAVSVGTLSPEFSADVSRYDCNIGSNTSASITAEADDSGSSIEINGTSVASGSSSSPLSVSGTSLTVRVKVIAPDGATFRVYIVVLKKEDSSQVSAPEFSLPDGTTFKSSIVITLSSVTTDASIYYTTDGSSPLNGTAAASNATLYSSALTFTATTTLRAVALKSGYLPSDVVSATYTQTVVEQVVAPEISPADGTTFTTTQTVSMSSLTSGAQIYYTTNGSDPTTSSSLYSVPFDISATTEIRAIAVKSDMTNSTVTTATITKLDISKVTDPVFSPVSGTTFTSTLSVSLTDAISDADIYYSTDSTAAKSAFSKYSSAITISATTTFRAYAMKSGMNDSNIVTATYTFKSGDENSLETTYYKTNPSGQVGKYKTGMNVTCTSMKSDGFTDWSSDLIIAQGVANDVAQSFKGSHEAPLYDTYALYAAWDDTYLYLGWQYVNVVDVVDPAQGYPISDNGKPWNGDIRVTLAFDIDSSKSATGCLSDGVTGVWDATGVWYNKFNNGLDLLMNFSAKPGVGTPGVFYMNSTGTFDYTAANCKTFSALGIVYGYIDGLLPSNVYGINKPGAWAGYDPSELTGETGFVDMLTLGHSKTQDTFYEMKIPLSALGITRSTLESNGIGVMLVSTFGCSAIGSIPYDPTVYDVVTEDYAADSSTSAEKSDVDKFTYKMARIGKL